MSNIAGRCIHRRSSCVTNRSEDLKARARIKGRKERERTGSSPLPHTQVEKMRKKRKNIPKFVREKRKKMEGKISSEVTNSCSQAQSNAIV